MSIKNLVDTFNEKFPVGKKVWWRSVDSENFPHQQYEVREAAYLNNGQPVAFLKGKAGFVSIEPRFVDYDRTETDEGNDA